MGNTSVEVPLPDGGVLHVALGQEQGVSPADGRAYAIKWAQDDAGRLVVLDVLPLGAGGAGLGIPGLDDASGGPGAGRGPSGAGLRRRLHSGQLRRTSSLSKFLNAGMEMLLGSRSPPASQDSGSGHSSSSGGQLGGGARARDRSSSGGGAAAAELGERGFRVSGGGGGLPPLPGRNGQRGPR